MDLTAKRVAVIGTGASANQIVPAIAPRAGEVVVYQRSAHWMMSHPQYGKALVGDERWLVDHVPTYREWYRFRQFWTFGDSILDAIRIDPEWPHPERSVNEANDRLRAQLTEYIEGQLAERPELVDKLVPDYPPYAKRMVVDNGWYQALRRDNVTLVTAPIVRITESGIESADGHRDVDVIAFATGFYTNRVLWPIEITGRGGVDVRAPPRRGARGLQRHGADRLPEPADDLRAPRACGHGGNGMFFAETAIGYITEVLRGMFERGWRRIEVRPEAVREYSDRMAEEVTHYVWNTPGVTSWFRGERDTPTAVVPRKLVDIWHESKAPDLSVYEGA